MIGKLKLKRNLLLFGDLIILYLSLFIALFLRYRSPSAEWDKHFLPFSLLFIFWLAAFYIEGLYDPRYLRNTLDFSRVLILSLTINFGLSVIFFYLFPVGITPKTTLFIFIAVFALLEIIWRRYFNLLTSFWAPTNVILIGDGREEIELRDFTADNKQLGYRITWFPHKDSLPPEEQTSWRRLISRSGADLIVVPGALLRDPGFSKNFIQLLDSGIQIKEVSDLFETIFRRIPLNSIDEEWFLRNITNRRKFYETLKIGTEPFVAFLLFVLLLPLELLIALFIKLTSSGPVIYKQVRLGLNGRKFVLYKFRTMRKDAEKEGPKWAEINDKRSTRIGRILRMSHLDELPQLLNIIKGELSFVGPRPERPEFVDKLEENIPYYKTRYLIRPGLTGWAQINYGKDASLEDVERKIEFDLYYLKNRSVALDLAILLKTVKSFFVNPY